MWEPEEIKKDVNIACWLLPQEGKIRLEVMGVQRTGTNYMRELLQINAKRRVLVHEHGGKHGKIVDLPDDLRIVVVVKHPYSWMQSMLRWKSDETHSFMREGHIKIYNEMYRHYMEMIQASDSIISVKYEDLLFDRKAMLEKICESFGIELYGTRDIAKVAENDAFTEERREYYRQKFPPTTGVDWQTFNFFGYKEEA